MAILINDNYNVNAGKPVDSKYLNGQAPWTSIAAANTGVVLAYRYTGLTVNILGVEYWYATGVADGNLVIKDSGLASTGLTAAINGLTKIGNIVKLGGTLTGNTTINGLHNFDINIANVNFTGNSAINLTGIITLQSSPVSGVTTDSLLVWNSSDKQIKQIPSNIVNVCNISTQYTATTNNTFIGVSGTSCVFLLSNPTCGQRVSVADICGNALSYPITINGNGKRINDDSCTCSSINTNYGSITFIYNGHFWSAVAFTN